MAAKSPMVRMKRTVGNSIVVCFDVPTIDSDNYVTIVDELEAVVRSPDPQSVVIDLTGVRQIDELGLVVLRSIQESIKDVGGTAVFLGSNHHFEQSATKIRLPWKIDDRDPLSSPASWRRC